MTALVISTDIPTNINTLEKLVLWAGLASVTCNPQTTRLEAINNPQFSCQYYRAQAADGSLIAVVRSAIALDPLIDYDITTKAWQKALQHNQSAIIPAGYKTN